LIFDCLSNYTTLAILSQVADNGEKIWNIAENSTKNFTNGEKCGILIKD